MKYTSVIICIVLLICTVFLLPSTAKSGVTVGKGDGKNEKITSIEDLLGMLHCIQSGDFDGTLSINSEVLKAEDTETLVASLIAFSTSSDGSQSKATENPQKLSSSSDKEEEDDKEITKYDFDSFTVHEYAHMLYDYGKTFTTLDRELSIYVDGKNTYYRSKGQTVSRYEIKDEDGDTEIKSTLTDFDMEFYINGKKNKVYVKINYFYMIDEETTSFSSEIIGKWLDIESDDFLDSFLSINESNLDALSDLSSAIETAYEDGELKNKTKTQTLNKRDFGKLFEEYYDRFDARIDISNAESPTISLIMSSSSVGEMDMPSLDIQMEAVYTFENIDNTEVSMDSSVDIFEIDEDDIEDYIWTE